MLHSLIMQYYIRIEVYFAPAKSTRRSLPRPSLIPARSERGNRAHGCCSPRGTRRNCGRTSPIRARPTPSEAHCSRHNRSCPHCTGRRNRCGGNPKRGPKTKDRPAYLAGRFFVPGIIVCNGIKVPIGESRSDGF